MAEPKRYQSSIVIQHYDQTSQFFRDLYVSGDIELSDGSKLPVEVSTNLGGRPAIVIEVGQEQFTISIDEMIQRCATLLERIRAGLPELTA